MDLEQPPEGALIEHALARHVPKLSARKAAQLADISEGRWRQIVSGYQTVTPGMRVPVTAPPATLARMAMVVGVSAGQLARAGREDAAALLLARDVDPRWARLGTLIRRAREALDLNAAEFADRAGIAAKTVLRLEAGEPVRTRTLVAIDRGFGWPYGTTEAALTGGSLPETGVEPEPRDVRIEELVQRSSDLTAVERDALLAVLRALRLARIGASNPSPNRGPARS